MGEILLQTIFVLPFIVAIILLITALETQKNISLLPAFNLNFNVIFITLLSHSSVIILLSKWKNIDMGFAKLKPLKRALLYILASVVFFVSSVLIVMSLKMNLNFWWKSDKVEKVVLTVENKRVSEGRGTDYYIEFYSNKGSLTNKVNHITFDKYEIGETFNASVHQGYFEGFFLTEEIK